jgi:hypothetical protein
MNKSLLIGLLLLTSAARASAQTGPYNWVAQTTLTVPVNAVKDPLNRYAACKGTLNSQTWVGYLDTSAGNPACIAATPTGTRVVATANVFVLTRTTVNLRWVDAPDFNNLGVSNVVIADGWLLCAVGGYVGRAGDSTCLTSPAVAQTAQTVRTVLTW